MSIQEAEEERISREPPLSYETLMRARLEFAVKSFTNAQELIRFMDQKANFLLAVVTILTAALGIVGSKALDVVPRADWETVLKGAGVVSLLVYLVMAFLVIFNATRVFHALPRIRTESTRAPGLIFPLMLLERYNTDERQYLDKLSNLSMEEMLHDYANQIMETSMIYQRKQHHINLSTNMFSWLTISWITTMLLLSATAILH